MLKNILIIQMKQSTELLGEKVSEKEIKRLETMRYDKLIQEAEYARQAISIQVQNEILKETRAMILEGKLKGVKEENGQLM